ncbi:MAG: response regulator [Oscillospiraceae bacterium]|nr:response regulator [Oscillospiraceae bacterium]
MDSEELEHLRDENNRLRSLISSFAILFLTVDREGTVQYVSRSYVTHFGIVDPTKLVGKHFSSVLATFFGKQSVVGTAELLTKLNEGAFSPRMEINARRGGKRFECVLIKLSEDFNGGEILVKLTDVTAMYSAVLKAEEAANAKTAFLATMSHEIRTPMNAIIGLQNAVKQEPLTARQQNYLENMRRSSQSLLSIINDILDFSKIESGKLQFDFAGFDLPEFLRGIYETSMWTAKQKGLILVPRFSANLPKYFFSDENKLRQILNNLLSNSVKYTPCGFVELRVRKEPKGAKAPGKRYLRQDMLAFTVTDTGIGIKKEDMSKLFSPFEQLDLRRNKNVVGTGLGLAITGKMASGMGGFACVESVYNEGSAFSVYIPYKEAEPPEVEDDFDFDTPLDLTGLRVLVVDDVDVNLIVAEAVLGEYGITPDLAASGQKSLDMAAEKDYDIVFMDQMMPIMDGLETTMHLRHISEHYKNIPIIALTANVTPESHKQLRNAGCNDILLKPIEDVKMKAALFKWGLGARGTMK